MDSSTTNRLVVPDMVKGFAMVCIMLVHFLLSATLGTPGSTGPVEILSQILALGLMSFFVIAGYFYRPRGFACNVKKRLTKLVIALVACTLILPIFMYGYFTILGYDIDFVDGYLFNLTSLLGYYVVLQPFDANIAVPLMYSSIGYYFINLIIVASIVFYAVVEHALKNRNVTIAWLLGLVLATAVIREVSPIHLPFQIELVPLTVAFMLFGALLARIRFIEKLESNGIKNRKFWMMFLGGLAITILLGFAFPPGRSFHLAYLGEYGGWSAFPFFIDAILMTGSLLFFGLLLSHIPVISNYLSFLGQHTLAILLLHTTLGKMIGYLISDTAGPNSCAVLSAPVAIVLVIVVSLITAYMGKLFTEKIAPRMGLDRI